MTGKTHQIIGIITGLAWVVSMESPHYGPATLATVIVGSHLASLLPDFDGAQANFWKSIPYGGVIGKIVDPFVKHRNISHSIVGCVIVWFLLGWLYKISPNYWGIESWVVVPIMLAYISHLVADMLTADGIPLFFPFGKAIGIPPRPFEGIRIVTGQWFENLIIFPLVNIVLIALVWSNWSVLRLWLFVS